MQTRIVGVSLSVERRAARATSRSTTATRARRRSSTARRRSHGLAPGSPIPRRRSSARTSSTTSTRSPTRAWRSRGVAHDTLLESYVLESHKPHDMDNLAWRHLNVKTITYDDVTGKGVNRIPFEQVARRPRDGIRGRGRGHHAAPARGAVIRRSRPTPRLEFVYAQHRDAGARRAVPHGAQRHPDRCAAAREAGVANSASA